MLNKPTSISIILTSFLILFLELSLIRLVPAYVININYYTNFILMACFLGIGIGLILGKHSKNYYIFLPSLLVVFFMLIAFTRLGTKIDESYIVVLQRDYGYYHLPSWLVVGTIFSFVTLIFITLGQKLGVLFAETKDALKAYSWDLIGSLVGIAVFFLYSLLSLPPVVWIITFSIVFLLNLYIKEKKFNKLQSIIVLVLVIIVFFISKNSIWSPYYKIDLSAYNSPKQDKKFYELFVNDIGHQNLVEPEYKEYIYFSQYKYLNNKNYDSALIIGAGGGNDVAVALANGVKNIDAVEIDPQIVGLGKKYHPSQPYSNSNVNVIVNDGRNYLNETDKKYDMIIFALTDSLTQLSQQGAIRLESYLFTEDSFQQAKSHLKDDGILVLYNYYWKDWLVNKLGYTLETTFGQKPYVIADKSNYLASFVISEKPLEIVEGAPKNDYTEEKLRIATDEWPFIYLQKNYIPSNYVYACLAVLLFSFFLVWFAFRNVGRSIKNIYLPLFFTGAAFMLLETTALARFALVFGSTWVVNSFVFFGILTLSLISNLIMVRFKKRIDIKIGFLLLLASLLVYFAFPFKELLGMNVFLRYFVGIMLAAGPIFFAGLTFSSMFADTKESNVALGSNLLGAILGGILEYFALITGYKFLIVLSLGLYVLAILSYYLPKKNIFLKRT